MPQRPDSPIANTTSAPEPDPTVGEEQEIVHHVSQRKKRKKGVGGEEIELQLTSMIDVIFQLLIYFVITANFQIDEGTILATLPGNAAQTDTPPPPITPLLIELSTADDGVTYTMRVRGSTDIKTVTQLYGYLDNRVKTGAMAADDPVEIKPQGQVRWQHVVNVFNACVRADLEAVGFAPS